ncbi:MAG: prolyl oligopeptidase family serine peptidase [Verrucomicrobiota bacterium]
MNTPRFICASFIPFLAALSALADGPKDNIPDQVRPIPPAGIELPEAEKITLQKSLNELGAELQFLKGSLNKKPALEALLPDVEIYFKAVDWAIRYNEFFKPTEFNVAKTLLEEGLSRAKSLREGLSPWTTQTGLVVRGYRSKIDGSVQPYGVVVPAGYLADGATSHRLDIWCHGRGETLTELNFIEQRRKSPGEFTPRGAFVLHPYGRYCNANKFAGESDLFEALDHMKRNYRIDTDRMVMRGFSMGGAAAWQFTVHHPGLWVASNPGAGFTETPEFLRGFQGEEVNPPTYVQRLWSWYDCPGYVRNLANCPTIAYSGEDDKQRQAAEVMAEAAKEQGFRLTHIIGPKTGHKIHADSKVEIEQRLERIVAKGKEHFPNHLHFSTFTLRYPTSHWVTMQGLEHHWNPASIDATVERDKQRITMSATNVTAFSLHCGPGEFPMDPLGAVIIELDGEELLAPPPNSDRSWSVHFVKARGHWCPAATPYEGLVKRPGLQGPIDDAFLEKFIVVRPTGKASHPAIESWVQSELAHFVEHWRKQFRGELVVRDDTSITDDDLAEANLILWGDPASNQLIGKIVEQLPIRWDGKTLGVGEQNFDVTTQLPALIYPNPLYPNHYIVLNSGFTYREYDYLNNARQGPKLPDWAIIDTKVPATTQTPGGVSAAGFFGERWEVSCCY